MAPQLQPGVRADAVKASVYISAKVVGKVHLVKKEVKYRETTETYS